MSIVPIDKSRWTKDKIREALVSVITVMQTAGGSDLPEFSDELVLMLDVARFDSLVAVDALTVLSDLLGCELPDGLFYDPLTLQPLTLAQIVERIYRFLHPPA